MMQTTLTSPARGRRLATCLFLAGALASLPACGNLAGEAATTSTQAHNDGAALTRSQALAFTTKSLPAGQPEVPYPATQLQVTGGNGAVAFEVHDGELPSGVSLTRDGRLIGLPHETGVFHFTARAKAGYEEADQALVLAVDDFGVAIVGGRRFQEAWSGEAVELRSGGAVDAVTYEIVRAESGGRLLAGTTSTGAVYVPGAVGGAGGTDVIRATDTTTGKSAEIEISVRPSPIGGYQPDFGGTDVWHVNFAAKRGTHPYASDWHHALVALGLRNTRSFGTLGSEADRKADMLARCAVLAELNALYLRSRDGYTGPQGLAVTFAYDRPDMAFDAPMPGDWLQGGANRYSVIEVCDADRVGAVGAAMLDDANRLHVNNAPGGNYGQLGVFVNRILEHVQSAYRTDTRDLASHSIEMDDLDRLNALLYEKRTGDSRSEDIAYAVRALGRSTAAVLAHEIGHSVGLEHTSRTTSGSVMNYAATIHPAASYAFLPEDVQTLRENLPGAGRNGATYRKMTGDAGARMAAAELLIAGGRICDGGRSDD